MHGVAHAGFLAVAVATHALVGYAVGAVAFDAPRAGLLGGVAADVDLLFPTAWGPPLGHRGVTHSALAVGVAAAVAASRGADAGAVGVAYAAHLALDATTPMGIPVAYPLAAAFVGVDLGGHSPAATAALWLACLALLARDGLAGPAESPDDRGRRHR